MKIPLREMAVYVTVGATATFVDYGSYLLLTRGFAWLPLVANPLSYLAGNAVSFGGHRFLTFRSRSEPLRQYARFLIVTAAGIGVSQATIALVLGLGISDLISKAAAVLVSGSFNYLMNRYWTFRTIGHRP
jgi:putative flippase GtrA